MRMNVLGGSVLVSSLNVCAAPAAAVLIDDFSQGLAVVERLNVPEEQRVVQTGLDPSRTLGGRRVMAVEEFAAVGGIQIGVDPSSEGTFFSETTAVPGDATIGYYRLVYGVDSRAGENDLGIIFDLTADGSDAFEIDVVSTTSLDFPNTPLLEVASPSAIKQIPLSDFLTEFGSSTIRIPFDSPEFTGVDFSQVNRIQLNAFRITADQRFVISEIRTVPEPATLTGLLLLGPLLARRPKR